MPASFSSLSPVVLFVFDRPNHTEQTLKALSRNDLIEQTELFIYADGPKTDSTNEQIKNIESVREVIRKQKWSKEVHVIESPDNKGLAGSIVSGVTEIINKYGRIIVIEDDIITSAGFLRFMNDALEFYADEDKVMHISGYMYPHKEKLPETFFYQVPYPGGGWATWKRAWDKYIDDTDYLYNYFNSAKGWWQFNKFGGDYLQRQLKMNLSGELKTWFIKWHATLLINRGLTLYPGQSLTHNIGFDNSGSNCPPMTKFDIINPAEIVKIKEIPIKESRKARIIIRQFYQGNFTVKSFIYSLLTRIIKKEGIQKIKRSLYFK